MNKLRLPESATRAELRKVLKPYKDEIETLRAEVDELKKTKTKTKTKNKEV